MTTKIAACPKCHHTHSESDAVALSRFTGVTGYRTPIDGEIHATRADAQEWLCERRRMPSEPTTTTDLAAHLDTRLANLTPAQRTIAARHLQGACTLLNLTRNTSQAAWLNAVDEAREFGAAS